MTTFEISSWGDGDEPDVRGVVSSRDAVRDMILNLVEKKIGQRVPFLVYAFHYNAVRDSLMLQKVTYIREDHEGCWTLIWHVDDEVKTEHFMVNEQ